MSAQTSLSHSPNCQCDGCTGGDARLAHIRGRFGANSYTNVQRFATIGKRFSARPGVYGTNHADAASIIQPISNPSPGTTVAQPKNQNLSAIFDLALGALGAVMDNQKNGVQQPPILDKIGSIGNQVTNAGVNAGVAQANSTVGEQVIKFSPFIIGGLVLVGGGMIWLIAKKS